MQKAQKTTFWIVLAAINVAVLIYPVSLYVQADGNETQFFAAIVLLGVAFLVVITDTVSVIITSMGQPERSTRYRH